MALIELCHVSKSFEHKGEQIAALQDINISIEESDIYGIIGMSGAGKSTLVRCLNYLERPTEGKILIDGKNMGTLTERELRKQRKEIAMIFQHFNLLMQRNVISNVAFPLRLMGVGRREAAKRAAELLKTVGLEEKAKAYPSQLSGGQKQRVAIARALASNPKILLCDEATSALDPQTTASILKLLKRINQELGITIVMITHQMSVVQEICNRVAIIDQGRLSENGTVEEVFANPRSRAARELIFGSEIRGFSKNEKKRMEDGTTVRVVFSNHSAFEPVIANMILHFGIPVNILQADTKNVGGMAKGEMILGLPEDNELAHRMVGYMKEKGLRVQEVTEDV